MTLFDFIISLFSGSFAGLGFGGGWILYAYAVGFKSLSQSEARGLVLLLFIPCAAVALAGHIKNKLIEPKNLWLPVVLGVGGVFLGFWFFGYLNEEKLKWLMGAAVFIFGAAELCGGIKAVIKKTE